MRAAAARLRCHVRRSQLWADAIAGTLPWPRYRLIGVTELAAAAGILIGLWWHPLGLAAAAGMTLLLIGALITHRRAGDSGQEAAPALAALALTIAYLAIALSSWA